MPLIHDSEEGQNSKLYCDDIENLRRWLDCRLAHCFGSQQFQSLRQSDLYWELVEVLEVAYSQGARRMESVYIGEMSRQTRQNTANILNAVMAGVKLGEE